MNDASDSVSPFRACNKSHGYFMKTGFWNEFINKTSQLPTPWLKKCHLRGTTFDAVELFLYKSDKRGTKYKIICTQT